MKVEMLKAKLHRARITHADVNYEGSLGIDAELMEAVGLHRYEKILVSNINNGDRLETYVIAGKRGTGDICMNGAAALRVRKGDRVIIMGFELADGPIEPKKVLVDEGNRFVRYL